MVGLCTSQRTTVWILCKASKILYHCKTSIRPKCNRTIFWNQHHRHSKWGKTSGSRYRKYNFKITSDFVISLRQQLEVFAHVDEFQPQASYSADITTLKCILTFFFRFNIESWTFLITNSWYSKKKNPRVIYRDLVSWVARNHELDLRNYVF